MESTDLYQAYLNAVGFTDEHALRQKYAELKVKYEELQKRYERILDAVENSIEAVLRIAREGKSEL